MPVDLKQPWYGELVGSKSVIRTLKDVLANCQTADRVSTILYAQNLTLHEQKMKQKKAGGLVGRLADSRYSYSASRTPWGK
jgi:hypothetical protein